MKTLKIISILIMISMLCLPADAGKRKPRIPMNELTDPESPSYVPFPYPKNRTEVIADIKYYYVDLMANVQSISIDGKFVNETIARETFKANSKYKFGKIVKVKNRIDTFADDYWWLAYILDKENDAVMRVTVKASGLLIGSAAIDKTELNSYPTQFKNQQRRLLKVIDEENVKGFLTDALGEDVVNQKIKKIERLGCYSFVSAYDLPLWEITMKDGTVYYYSELRDKVYRVSERKTWKKDKNGHRPSIMELANKDYFPERLKDQIVILEWIPRKR